MSGKYGLSETGKKKAEASAGEGSQSLRYAIIGYIETHGESSVQELADSTNTNLQDIKRKVNQLQKEGWLISIGDMDEDDW